MTREDLTEPEKPVKKLDDPVKEDVTIVLRKGNEKSFPCPYCSESFNSKQALWYHLHTAQNPCRDKEDRKRAEETGQPLPQQRVSQPAFIAADPQPPPKPAIASVQDPPPPTEDPAPAGPAAAAAPAPGPEALQEDESVFDGETPPVPMVLVYIILVIMGLLFVVVIFWQQLWKLYKKIGGGDADGGNPAGSQQQ